MTGSNDLHHWLFGRQDLLHTNPVLWMDRVASSLPWDRPVDIRYSISTMDRVLQINEVIEAGIPSRELALLCRKGWISQLPSNMREPERPGVVGLVADDVSSFVVPLVIAKSETWGIDPKLPFRAETLQDQLTQLASHLSLDDFLPERFCFDVRTSLKQFMEGPSMDLAAFVAIMVSGLDEPGRLFEACAVVAEQDARGELRSSGFAVQKLNAFVREFGHGSLLIRPKSCRRTAEFDHQFTKVWAIENLSDLFARLEEQSVIESMIIQTPATNLDLANGLSRLKTLVYAQHRYREGLDLARRLGQCRLDPSVSYQQQNELMDLRCQLERHLGDPDSAIQTAKRLASAATRLVAAASYDQAATVDIAYASSLFDAQRFDELLKTLQPWLDRCRDDPKSLSPITRVMVQNTFARGLIAAQRDGWESIFEQTLAIQRELFPDDVSRTENYLLLGMIRSGRISEAQQRIGQPEDWQSFPTMSLWMRSFLRADLARCQCETWQSEVMDSTQEPPSGCAHPLAFYMQSTARQLGRSQADRAARFSRADQLLGQDIEAAQGQTIESIMRVWLRLLHSLVDDDPKPVRQWISDIEVAGMECAIPALAAKNREWLKRIQREITPKSVATVIDELIVL